MAVTPNRGLTIINGATDLLSAGDDVINANSTILDKATVLLQGTMASRPAQPHPVGVLYQPTDVSGYLYLSTGSQWLEVAPGAGAAPIGSLMDWAGTGDVAGGTWLLCDGRSMVRADNSALFNALGGAASPWGVPDSLTFNLPDFRGRTTVGTDNMGSAAGAANRLPNSLRARGQASGEERHGLLATEHATHFHSGTTLNENSSLAHAHDGSTNSMNRNWSHNHYAHNPPINPGDGTWSTTLETGGGTRRVPFNNNFNGGALGWVDSTDTNHEHGFTTNNGGPPAHTHNFSTANQGSGTPFNVMQPYAVANKIIRVL